MHDGVTMGEVEVGCVANSLGRLFLAERGRGLREGAPVAPARPVDAERMFWTYGFAAGPRGATAQVLAELIDPPRSAAGRLRERRPGAPARARLRRIRHDADPHVSSTPTSSRPRASSRRSRACSANSSASDRSGAQQLARPPRAAPGSASSRPGRLSPTRRAVRSTTARCSGSGAEFSDVGRSERRRAPAR